MLLTTDMIVRELINGAWFVLNLYMVGIFLLYLVPEIRRVSRWYAQERNKAALGLLFYFSGGALFHGWIWYLLRMARLQVVGGFLANSYAVIVASAIFAFVGALLCIAVFSEKRWGHVAWLGALVIVVAFLGWEIFAAA
jgi:hypothetical protein